MIKNIYQPSEKNMAQAAQYIRAGKLVSFPTDTVYGLGANVYNSQAVANIFKAKERPLFDPLISHIAEIDFLPEYAETDSRALDLAKHFWPGPLTFVLKRKDDNPSIDLACAGLGSIAVRMPNHPVALELIKKSGVPIVAPSANRFKSISPTTAQHVQDSLGDRVDMILDGGSCRIGVETTIIDLTTPHIVMLRAGGMSKEELEIYTGEKVYFGQENPNMPKAPGQLLKHYAPRKPMRINVKAEDVEEKEFYIGFGENDRGNLNLSPQGDVNEAAANLFAYMREAEKASGYEKIAMAPIPETGLGLAINDRIKRASYKE